MRVKKHEAVFSSYVYQYIRFLIPTLSDAFVFTLDIIQPRPVTYIACMHVVREIA